MARVILSAGETYNAANDDTLTLGSDGFEQVNIFAGVTGVSVSGNIDRVNLKGNVADYAFSAFGASLSIFDLSGNLVAAVSDAGGKQIGFQDEVLDAVYGPTEIKMSLGSADIPGFDLDTETPATPEPIREFGWIDENTYISGEGGGYSIWFDVHNAPDQSLLQGITNAAESVSDIVAKGVPDYTGINDIWVSIHFTDLDTSWGTGSAHGLRPDSQLPSRGIVKLDIDASQNIGADRFEDLVFHEFLHTMGFGALWDDMGLIDDYNGDLRFNGSSATTYYNSEFPSIAANDPNSHLGVPVETDGAAGTAGNHWDEATFGDEIMTGYLQGSNHVSDMTIAALQDMGYDVML